MGKTKTIKKKKNSKKHKRRRHDTDVSSSDSESDASVYKEKRRKEKKRKSKRKKFVNSGVPSGGYGDMDDILKTPPKHQKMKRIMYRKKIRNIDPDIFLPLRRFAYDKEKMVQQAFLTLRRGVLEKICPPELEHLSMDELKTRLVNLAKTMSKERLRAYANDEDMTHSSDSYEPDTPTDESNSDMEVVDEGLEQITEKRQTEEREIRERLTRRMMEKNTQKEKELEEGEIISDDEIPNIPLPKGLPPSAPGHSQFFSECFIPPPPPPEPESDKIKNKCKFPKVPRNYPMTSSNQPKTIPQYDSSVTENQFSSKKETIVKVIPSPSKLPTTKKPKMSTISSKPPTKIEPKEYIKNNLELNYDDIGEDPEINLY